VTYAPARNLKQLPLVLGDNHFKSGNLLEVAFPLILKLSSRYSDSQETHALDRLDRPDYNLIPTHAPFGYGQGKGKASGILRQ